MGKPRDKRKVKAVTKIYAHNGFDMQKALQAVGDNLEPKALSVKASRWRNSIEIQEELKKELARFDKSLVDDIYCIANLVEIVNDIEIKPADRINALNVLAKIIGASKDGLNIQNNIVLTDLMKDLPSLDVKSIPIVDTNNSQQSAPTDITPITP